MECRWNYSKFLRANKTNPNIFAYAKNRKPAVACRRFTEIRPADWQGSGLCLESRPRQRSARFWGSPLRLGSVPSRNEDAQSPRSNKKRISHLPAQGARPQMTPGAVGTRAGKARLRDTAASAKLFEQNQKIQKPTKQW